ncbi:MAG: hypothetical protein E4H00_08490 [Myxococcales bacterium]|nr:MAG: hypothetical protein E4H00_08490 [Myxococcales bacterium]
MIEPELVLPEQFFSSLAKQPAIESERRLMLAVLEDAVSCYQRFALARDARGRAEFEEARRWIESDEREWPYSYENICEVLGLNPTYIREGLRRRGEYAERKTKIQRVAAYVMPLRTQVATEEDDVPLNLSEESGEKAA